MTRRSFLGKPFLFAVSNVPLLTEFSLTVPSVPLVAEAKKMKKRYIITKTLMTMTNDDSNDR